MHSQKKAMLWINIIGGIAVLGSYVMGILRHPGSSDGIFNWLYVGILAPFAIWMPLEDDRTTGGSIMAWDSDRIVAGSIIIAGAGDCFVENPIQALELGILPCADRKRPLLRPHRSAGCVGLDDTLSKAGL